MKDTNAPARVLSGYLLFVETKRKEVAKSNPELSMTQLSAIYGKLWAEASAKVKQPFLTKSAKLREARDKKMETYKQTPEYAEYQKRFRTDKLIRKYANQLGVSKVEFRSFPSDPNGPKRPNTSFFCFSNEVRGSIMKNNPDNTMAETCKIIGERWKKLSDAQKAKYEKMAADERSKYETVFAKYQKSNDFKEYTRVKEEYLAAKKSLGQTSKK